MRKLFLRAPCVLLASAGFFSYRSRFAKASDPQPPSLFVWGSGMHGQLGLGTDINSISVPQPIEELAYTNIRKISSFSDISAAISDEGELLAWGKTRGGALVDAEQQIFSTNLTSPTPISIIDNKPISHVAVGRDHLAAVTVDGKLVTMGNPNHGKLGHAAQEEKTKLVRGYKPVNYADRARQNYVGGELGDKKVVDVVCGYKHTAALTDDGKVYTWGAGKEGELGHGDTEEVELPKLVEVLKEKKVVKLGAGNGFTIALTDGGELFSWGANQFGQLGDAGVRGRPQTAPTKVKIHCKAVDFACGEDHAAFVSDNGEVYTWGYGNDGQLGHKVKASATYPKKVMGLPEKVESVQCGGGHTGVILKNGRVFMFGRGKDGQLGRGEGIEAMAASRPQPLEVFSLRCRAEKLALGSNHSLALCMQK